MCATSPLVVHVLTDEDLVNIEQDDEQDDRQNPPPAKLCSKL